MTVADIRKTFVDFFENKGHTAVPSAPMVVKNDPTLMFINAGMNQFKDYFLGNTEPKNRRVVNSQKCLRVSGKHNDLDEVGVDTYHHTMFEMLGNWSFGDYFKEEAIAMAWELLTKVYELPKDRLYVTVFEGDASDNIGVDQESIDIWKSHIDASRIIKASKKDNFWEMGDVGPCGPCTEIHIDLRNDEERQKTDGKSLINADHPQVIEIWNVVFIQFDRKANKSLSNLPETHVDTGMGLERLAMALQGKQSNYDIDLFQAIINKLEEISNITYGNNEASDIALRVIADHLRAISFSIADGQLPSNTGAGYVIRRILRRAIRYAYQTLDLKEPFMGSLVPILIQEMAQAYPELKVQEQAIIKVITEEENSFYRTLAQGIKRINQLIIKCKSDGKEILDGKSVFELYDTYGFPLDLTSLIAREQKLAIDSKGFNLHLEEQKNRSRKATSLDVQDWITVTETPYVGFNGYDHLESSVNIIKYREVQQKGKLFYQLVLNETPFYPEGGGQVGDQGVLIKNEKKIFIFDTKKENNLILHFTKEIPDELVGTFSAQVNTSKRFNAARNHSATHLLHHALQKVLGAHVEQKGSLVQPDGLRFDFSHFSKVNDEELKKIESIVLKEIQENHKLEEFRKMPIEKAKKMGATALFGEKYGSEVRLIKFNDSLELCGGTHISNTNEIGMFTIISEAAVASGIRRIEAICGDTADAYFRTRSQKYEAALTLLKKPKNLELSIQDLIVKNQTLNKTIEVLQKEQSKRIKTELKNKIVQKNGVNFLAANVETPSTSAKDILFQLKAECKDFVGIIGNTEQEKCGLHIIISDNLVNERGWNASNWIKEVSAHIQGGGGGQPFYASAGGKNAAGIPQAIKDLEKKI
ncbi:MAG: alanine--tRNA ligase [Crocinitomicaceae bacterium]|jgi:alanyl-tRNA synthetase|nr:alanine--tRNA ligase [Crocinitomicaceae bacterium]